MRASKPRKKRIPELKYTTTRNIGWHVSFRDPKTNTPKKHRFDASTREEALELYEEWLAKHLAGNTPPAPRKSPAAKIDLKHQSHFGSILTVASSLIDFDEDRTREPGEPRRPGTISRSQFEFREHGIRDFLAFMNTRYASGAVARLRVDEISMHDVEAFNRKLVLDGGSDSFVTKRMALVKALIDRAGRPEFEHQSLPWNWESRDKIAGKLAVSRKLPTLRQLKRILRASKERERAMVWMGIGLGFGQSDISQTCVGQINKKTYDLRRGKTNVERYGETPPMVWKAIQDYLKDTPRPRGELLFVTRRGHPLVHGKKSDAIKLWWRRLRKDLGYGPKTLDGFYVLRHLGATEYGSRGTNSINDVRRWLGHAASSQVADIYMRPVAAEHEELITWVRNALLTGKADLKLR